MGPTINVFVGRTVCARVVPGAIALLGGQSRLGIGCKGSWVFVMGVFRFTIEIGDPQGTRFESLDALVDTGASYTVVPAPILRRLGVQPRERVEFTLADGRVVEREIGETRVRVAGRTASTIVVFGDAAAGALLGAYTLEGTRLGVDPLRRTLVPVRAFLMRT